MPVASTDNQEFLRVDRPQTDTQLSLFRQKKVELPVSKVESCFLEWLRIETAHRFNFILEFWGESWDSMQNVPTTKLVPALEAYALAWQPSWPSAPPQRAYLDKLQGIVRPADPHKPRRKYIPYKAWSLERKLRRRLKELHERMYRDFSFVEMRQEALMDRVLLDPERFGICPLVGNSCPWYPPNFAQERAIAKENQLRMIEAGVLVPVGIPINLTADSKQQFVRNSKEEEC